MKQRQATQNILSSRTLKLHAIFYSTQGEGLYTGMPCIFVRFGGCNMHCNFCDTDYNAAFGYSQVDLFRLIESKCKAYNTRNVVLTGGEPLMQNIDGLMRELAYQGFLVHLETNGTFEINYNTKFLLKSISLSPKVPIDKLKMTECTSLKILFPYLEKIEATHFVNFNCKQKYLCPIYPEKGDYRVVIRMALDEVKHLPSDWHLGIQLHKLVGWV